MKVYGNTQSGNCMKVRYTADYLGLPYEWVEMDIFTGAARSAAFRAKNAQAQVPCLELDDGRCIAQSGAILLHLAADSRLIPEDPYERAKMMEWMFWEQNSHEPAIANCRADIKFRGKTKDDLDPSRVAGGNDALKFMDRHLKANRWFLGDQFTLADIALFAYTKDAPDGGFDLAPHLHVNRWLKETAGELGLS